MTTADWVSRWGQGSETDWLEEVLGLHAGAYTLLSTRERLTLDDPKEPIQRHLDVYDCHDAVAGVVRKVAMAELSNGISVVAYRKDAA